MLADFAVRLACGLAALLLATPWRAVPLAFFRTHFQVMLGLLVLAALDLSRVGAAGPMVAAIAAAAVLSYLGAIAWGMGLPRVGVPITVLLAIATGGTLIAASRSPDPEIWALDASGRLASAFVLGATLTAMLLGHHYLTAPAMSIAPLRRFVRCMAWGLAARGLVAAIGLGLWVAGHDVLGATGPSRDSTLFLAIRWGMGFAGPVLATVLAWKTVEMRSTQSATGILYIAMTLLLFGELSAMILARQGGVVF